MSTYTLIVPPIAETISTGLRGGAEKTIRGVTYRAELYPAGWRLFKNGALLRSWDDLPLKMKKPALAARAIIESGEAQKGTQ